MKILVVTQRYDPDPFLINEIAPEMVRRGHEVTVLTGLPSEAEKREKYRLFRNRREKINGVDVIRCYEAKRRDSAFGLALNYMSFALIASLKSLFLSRKFDSVFCYQLSPVTQILPAAVYRKVAGKKAINLLPGHFSRVGFITYQPEQHCVQNCSVDDAKAVRMQ